MILFTDNFSHGFFDTGEAGSKADWFYYKNQDFIGRDPQAQLSILKNRLSVHIPKYSLTTEGIDDHIKFLFFRNSINHDTGMPGDGVPDGAILIHEARARVKVHGTSENPFHTAHDDYRLSNGSLMAMDFDSCMAYGFVLTENQVQVIYQRIPFDATKASSAAYFTYIIPVAEIEPGTEHHYRTAYTRGLYTVTWFIDKEPVFSWDQFGKRLPAAYDTYCVYRDLPGSENAEELPLVKSHQFAFGAGLGTFLDAGIRHGQELLNCDDSNVPRDLKLFGQGGTLILGDICISVSH